jgi:hypothetical protein
MKKKSVILIAILLVVNLPVFAQNANLWNGLTSGMTEEQAIQRLRVIAGNDVIRIFEREPNSTSLSSSLTFAVINTAITELHYNFSQGLTKIRTHINNPAYSQDTGMGNVNLNFYNGRLIAVAVQWSAPDNTRNQMIRQQFGEPQFNNRNIPAWETSNIFIATNQILWAFEILFVDKVGFRNARQDDTRIRQQASGIQF